MQRNFDKLAIVIVNYNGEKWLLNCLNAIYPLIEENCKIVLVDNASTDQSTSLIEESYPNVCLIKSTCNLGFAAGNNLGIKYTNREYILLLNTDTIFQPKEIKKLLEFMQVNPKVAIVQPMLVLMNDQTRLDYVGSLLLPSTLLLHYGVRGDKNLSQYHLVRSFFSLKGACVLMRGTVIREIGLFDSDFWCYYEETDWCHRAWLAGYECWYYPEAVCLHANGGTSSNFKSAFIQFHNIKNKLCSFLKNFSIPVLIWFLPTYIIISLIITIAHTIKGEFDIAIQILHALLWNIMNISKTLTKRRKIQSLRRISDYYLLRKNLSLSVHLSYHFALFFSNTNLHKYEGPLTIRCNKKC